MLDGPNPILFLDFDGVLNSMQSASYFYRTKHNRKQFMQGFEEICPIAGNNLNNLLERVPELRVVVSSTWRLHFKLEEFEPKMLHVCPAIEGRIIGETPNLQRKLSEYVARGSEIAAWLKENGHENGPYLVLDDDSDMDGIERLNFIRTDERLGFSYVELILAFTRLIELGFPRGKPKNPS